MQRLVMHLQSRILETKYLLPKKEAAETRFWIDLVYELTSNSAWKPLRQEVHEILSILQAIINTTKEGSVK